MHAIYFYRLIFFKSVYLPANQLYLKHFECSQLNS